MIVSIRVVRLVSFRGPPLRSDQLVSQSLLSTPDYQSLTHWQCLSMFLVTMALWRIVFLVARLLYRYFRPLIDL